MVRQVAGPGGDPRR